MKFKLIIFSSLITLHSEHLPQKNVYTKLNYLNTNKIYLKKRKKSKLKSGCLPKPTN